MPVKQRLLDGRTVSVPPHQVAVLSEQPNLVLVNPQTAQPNAWQGSETFTDFELPDQLHVVTGLQLAMPIQIANQVLTGTDLGGLSADAVAAKQWDDQGRQIGFGLTPTPYWVSRIEIYAGKDIVETLYPEAIYNDAIAWRDIQNRREWSEPLNFTSDLDTSASSTNPLSLQLPYRNTDGSDTPVYTSSAGVAQNLVGTSRYWANYATIGSAPAATDSGTIFQLPIACSLTQGKVFAAGFVVPFKVRVYFASSIITKFSSAYVPTAPATTPAWPAGTGTVSLSQGLQLWVQEQQLSSVNFEAKLREHRNGNVLYKFVMKNRYQVAQATVQPGNPITFQLKAFKSLSAGLVFTILKQGNMSNPRYNQERFPIADLQLLDGVGRRITEVLPDQILRRFVFPRHIASDYTVYWPQYIIPFSSDFGETVRNAVNLGYNQMTTLEQLRFTGGAELQAATDVMLQVYSYDYATLSCNGGVPQVSYT
jgi:hypothetical protein